MSNKKKPQHRHSGIVMRKSDDGFRIALTRPHEDHECEAANAEATHEIDEHITACRPQGETIFEASDAKTTVGYSKAYAVNYDSVFGNN